MRVIAITLDVDWAPDFVIDAVADILIAADVRATWFVTHASAAINRLRERPDLFELGIHPNFLRGSTHGECAEDVLAHCMQVVPEAVSMRSHCLYQSGPLLEQVLRHTPITHDSSIFLTRGASVAPFRHQLGGRPLVRIPYVWEDYYEMFQPEPWWNPLAQLDGSGVVVLNFHPMHVYLDQPTLAPYEALKGAVRELSKATTDDVLPCVGRALAAGAAFRSCIGQLAAIDGGHLVANVFPG